MPSLYFYYTPECRICQGLFLLGNATEGIPPIHNKHTACVFRKNGNHAVCVIFRQYRTKSVWRLCTPSACKFPVIFHKNAREYIQYSLRFLFHLTKNLTTHLSHNLCAVLPKGFFAGKYSRGHSPDTQQTHRMCFPKKWKPCGVCYLYAFASAIICRK